MENIFIKKLKYIAISIFMYTSLNAVECPKYEDMIIVQKSKIANIAKNIFPKKVQVKDIKIITQSNPYFKQIVSIINKAKPPLILKVLQIKGWEYKDGITFCFANHPEKTIKIQNPNLTSEDPLVFMKNGWTHRMYIKKDKVKKLRELIGQALEKKKNK